MQTAMDGARRRGSVFDPPGVAWRLATTASKATLTVLAVAATASYLVTIVAVALLITGDVHTAAELVATYLTFCVSIVAALHFTAFSLFKLLDNQPSKSLPKFIEYASIAVLSVSLAEIITFAPSYYLYLKHINGNDESILQQIATKAKSEVDEYCGRGKLVSQYGRIRTETYYSDAYCQRLKDLTNPLTARSFVIAAYEDKTFMSYTPTETATSTPGSDEIHYSSVRNPIDELITDVGIMNNFKLYAEDEPSKAVLEWLSMLLLPLGIGLSLLKTSIELYADLKPSHDGPAPT
jgi:hypothetical protein